MNPRIAIVGGGGGVGSSVAFNLLLRDEPYDVTLIDGQSGIAVSHEMDLQQVVAAGSSGSVRIGGTTEIAAADVVVMSAAVPLTVNRSRMVYLEGNAAILRDVADRIAQAEPPAVLLVVTNPVDPLCTWAARRAGPHRRRVVGYTANDGLRLRSAVGDALGVASSRVDAWVLGEHGDACVPLLDRVLVDGERVVLGPAQRVAVAAFVRDWYRHHVALDSGRSSTWTSGHMIARMVAAIVHGTQTVWPASVMMDGEHGIHDVALSMPVSLGPGGVEKVHEWKLSALERDALRAAAVAVRGAADGLGD